MQALPDTLCYLNGEYTPVSEAKVSVLDRGFIFGDGIYEVVPVYGRKLFRFDEHMARLARSLTSLSIDNPHTAEEWLERCRRLIAELPEEDQMIYIQVTRGVAVRDHAMTKGIAPTVFMMVNTMKLPSAETLKKGVACVTASDFRWERADIKSTSLLGNVLARQISVDAGATETILMRDGLLLRYRTEGGLDGLAGDEGAFLACTFWLVDTYVAMGRRQEAVALFEHLLSLGNDLGLLAEEYDPVAKRQLGNFPQAFSHVGLINSAYAIANAQVVGSSGTASYRASGFRLLD